MDLYLEALDRQAKKEHENPGVVLILCAYKNDEVVEYAMSISYSCLIREKLQELVNVPEIEER